MEKSYHEFIGLYKNALPLEKCNEIIKTFEKYISDTENYIQLGANQFDRKKLGRYDFSMPLDRVEPDYAGDVNKALQMCLADYYEEFFTLEQIATQSYEVKIQKTPPRGGYHEWHCENSAHHKDRVLVWTVYLNDVPKGEGETEFIWQKLKVQPEAGTICIFPAGFTHTHRGNTVYSCDKYIATGWFEYAYRANNSI